MNCSLGLPIFQHAQGPRCLLSPPVVIYYQLNARSRWLRPSPPASTYQTHTRCPLPSLTSSVLFQCYRVVYFKGLPLTTFFLFLFFIFRNQQFSYCLVCKQKASIACSFLVIHQPFIIHFDVIYIPPHKLNSSPPSFFFTVGLHRFFFFSIDSWFLFYSIQYLIQPNFRSPKNEVNHDPSRCFGLASSFGCCSSAWARWSLPTGTELFVFYLRNSNPKYANSTLFTVKNRCHFERRTWPGSMLLVRTMQRQRRCGCWRITRKLNLSNSSNFLLDHSYTRNNSCIKRPSTKRHIVPTI